VLEIDFETRSDIDLLKRGSHIYFASPHTKPLMASYILNGSAVRRWLPHEPCPQDIRTHVEDGGMVAAHNSSFERGLWQNILTPKYGWPILKLEQCRCTLATASALGLPRSLDRLGAALDLTVKKDKIGKDLIRFFCEPRKPKANEDPNGLYFREPEDYPEKFELFRGYCDTDVLTEAEADSRMIPLSADEQAVWVLDQQIAKKLV
jgi:DNA polymerase